MNTPPSLRPSVPAIINIKRRVFSLPPPASLQCYSLSCCSLQRLRPSSLLLLVIYSAEQSRAIHHKVLLGADGRGFQSTVERKRKKSVQRNIHPVESSWCWGSWEMFGDGEWEKDGGWNLKESVNHRLQLRPSISSDYSLSGRIFTPHTLCSVEKRWLSQTEKYSTYFSTNIPNIPQIFQCQCVTSINRFCMWTCRIWVVWFRFQF